MERLRSKEKQLFEFLTAQKSFDSEKIHAHFPDFNTKAFASLKQRLLDRIARLLSQKAALRSPETTLRKELDIAKGLLAKGLISMAVSKCQNAIPEAIDFDLLYLANELLQVAKVGLEAQHDQERSSSKIVLWQAEITSRIQKEANSRTSMQMAEGFKGLPIAERKEESKRLLSQLVGIEDSLVSKALILTLAAKVKCCVFSADHDAAMLFIGKANQAVKAIPQLYHDIETQSVLSKIQLAEVGIHLFKHAFSEARKVLATHFQERQSIGLPPSTAFIEQSFWVEGQEAMYLKDSKRVHAFIARVEESIACKEVTLRWAIRIAFELATYLKITGEASLALKWLAILQRMPFEGYGIRYWTMSFVMEQVVLLQTRDWDALFAATRRALYHLNKYPAQSILETRLSKLLQQVAKTGNLDPSISVKLKEALLEPDLDPFIETKQQLFNIQEWARNLNSR